MTISAGSRLGPYEVISPLGAGGMGEVYRARDTRLARTVAVKVLPERVGEDAEALARFEREAKAVAALSHPNILAIHDFGTEGKVSYAVTELLDGETLADALREAALPPRRAAKIAIELAEGLAAAHAKGIVHRDVKPANVFLTRDGHLKILDFGLARDVGRWSSGDTSATTEQRLTDPGVVMGTVGYMSPEQVRGRPLDARSDIFSFGAVLYEMLSGRPPFQKPTSAETMTAILKEDPPELSSGSAIGSSLEHVAQRCLEKDVAARFQDTRDLVFALEMASRSVGSGAQAVAAAPAASRPLLAAALALLAVLAAAAWWLGSRGRRVEPPRLERVTFRRGYSRGARFGPDGRTLVYAAAWDGGPLRLYRKDPENPDALALDLPSANLLAVSPAGELAIALDCRASHAGVCKGTLARVPLTGGSPREVAEGVQQADYASSGELAIVRDMPQVAKSRLEFPPGKVLYETDGHVSFPRLSPDGRRIAFFDHPFSGDDQGSVAVVDVEGKKRTLTKNFDSLRGLAWSPSGEEIWFAGADRGARALLGVRLSGASRVLYRAPGPLTLWDVAKDGRILISREDERNGVMGRGRNDPAEKDLSWLEMSNLSGMSDDGQLLLLVEQGEAAGAKGLIFLRRMDGSPPVRLGDGFGVLSPDGRRMMAVVFGFPGAKIVPVGPGEPKTISGLEPLGMFWLPDSRQVLVLGRQSQQSPKMLLLDADTGSARPLPVQGTPATGLLITADGRRILADATDGSWTVRPLDGAAPVPVSGIEKGEEPIRFSADGRSVFVARPEEAPLRVFRVDLGTGARSHWRDFEPADRAGLSYVRNVLISADASAYAYQYRRWLSELYVVEGVR
jgi:WD40 repeat protein